MRHLPGIRISILAAVCLCGLVAASGLYKWTDDNGVLHVATSLTDVPERYRNQVQAIEADPTPAPTRPVSAPSPADAPAAPVEIEGELRRFEIPYENEGSARRMIIPVTFNGRVTAPMALDTGAPGMVISFDLAARIGVFSRDSGTLFTAAGGIGGRVPAILTIVDSVSVEGVRSVFVPTTVTGSSISPQFEGLIGMDFLANHTISIDTRKQVVVFQETEPDPDARGGHDEYWWRSTFEDFRAVRDVWREIAETGNRRSGSQAEAVVEFQAREAERLLQRLDMYASDNAVPQHWR